MAHHELQVVHHHVGDVIHVDGVLHGVEHRPARGTPGALEKPSQAQGGAGSTTVPVPLPPFSSTPLHQTDATVQPCESHFATPITTV